MTDSSRLSTIKYRLIKLVIFLLCTGYIIHYFYTNRHSLQITFRIDPSIIAGIIFISFLGLLTMAYRFKLIIHKCSGINPPFWQWFSILTLARFYNFIFAQSGNIYRGIEFKKKFGIAYTDYISAGISFTWMDLSIDLILSMIIISLVRPDLRLFGCKANIVVALIAACIILLPIAANFVLKAVLVKMPPLVWIKSKLSQVISAALNNIKDIKYLAKIIIWGLLVTVQTIFVYHLVFKSFSFKLNLPALMLFYSLLKISSVFIITPGNIGIQEIAFGVLSSEIGTGMAEGILISAFIRVIGTSTIIAIVIVAAVLDIIKKPKTEDASDV